MSRHSSSGHEFEEGHSRHIEEWEGVKTSQTEKDD